MTDYIVVLLSSRMVVFAVSTSLIKCLMLPDQSYTKSWYVPELDLLRDADGGSGADDW